MSNPNTETSRIDDSQDQQDSRMLELLLTTNIAQYSDDVGDGIFDTIRSEQRPYRERTMHMGGFGLYDPPVRHTFSDFLLILVLMSILAYASIQKMEILAIFTLTLTILILYKPRSTEAVNMVFEFLKQTRTVKFGDVDLSIRDYNHLLTKQKEWVQIILSDLNGEQISLILAIYRAGTHDAVDKDDLRRLRARGLIRHNKPTLTESTQVWLTELGNDVAVHLLQLKEQLGSGKISEDKVEHDSRQAV